MPTYLAPGIYVEERSGGPRPIEAVGTNVAAFVGRAPDPSARLNEAIMVTNWSQFARVYAPEGALSTSLSHAVYGFFVNGGSRCYVVNTGDGAITGTGRKKAGLDVLEAIDEIALVSIPGLNDPASYDAVLTHCERMKDRVAILDGPGPEPVADLNLLTQIGVVTRTRRSSSAEGEGGEGGSNGLRPRDSSYGAVYYPYLTVRDPLGGELVDVPPSGHIAGIYARNDATRGVHKAPANEVIAGALNVTDRLTQSEQELLYPVGINCIRLLARGGIRVWGARTLSTDAEWRYINVRRVFNQIEESIEEGTAWIVFEPNDRTLWKSITRDISAFLTRFWRDGALMGRTAEEAFFVKCDDETNTPDSINLGQVITVIGIAVVKPAEFIIFRISQSAGGVTVEAEGGPNA